MTVLSTSPSLPSLSSLISGPALLPIIQADSAAQAVQIAKAMQQGGISAVEVVLRTAAALDGISAIRQQCPDLLVGAGTVLSKADADNCKNAGAQFLVSPASTPALLQAMIDTGLAMAPGVSTSSEVAMALEMGLTELKFFPAHLSGGTEMLKALSGIYQQVRFCPTGGIAQHNLADYLSLSNVFVVGGSWISPAALVKAGDWQQITDLAAAAVAVAQRCKPVAALQRRA
ncbi:bifunctional 4-hydroxy-2-oxoglutarate aldolase/2-dehydro-3-deoxy-phosphogluconate aldolase [Rheinheimera riviphila]|uniref:Bifunctional 4-hydroxy-2-oxoglutarate aldolase/2-dehydro-3-deoxy-phosphogluconate aldolase n=1 Tax=Rheinheimera riviphila TaxID=1834037 RepID=A0A437QFG6_9GAMM|nr:bifunctional 4-hydroxy-2-oxoglutarate aldolase/2-dehydro-3-deoxy-phosphogluconate aldolase [Rheinheimera riviphila]RVU33275.1 bifunctional 4-hydroxy-2-oxoglutarate aldolase/2-dehydro-3-deoxy-phosphogluconate aldolase [Rheinheimera riviphila]